MGSINLEEAAPALPHNLMLESESDGYQSKTLNADDRNGKKNKSKRITNAEFRRQARNFEDMSSEQVFNGTANTSVIKTLDAPDDIPSKPRVLGKKYSNDTGDDPNNTKIDSDFVNRFYVDDE